APARRAGRARSRYAGTVLHAGGAGPAAAPADEPLLCTARRARILDRSDRPRNPRDLRGGTGRTAAGAGSPRERLSAGARPAAARRRRDRHRAPAVSVRSSRTATGGARVPVGLARPGSGAGSERTDLRRTHARHAADSGWHGRPCLRARADARGSPGGLTGRAARVGGADGVRLRRLLRLRRRDRRRAQAPLPGGAGAGRRSRRHARRGGRVRILNASGCLDALAAPDIARQLDAFVTKTVTPLPREGNAPPRIAETAHGMLNAIGLANPGRESFLADHLPRLRELGVPLWISVGGFCAEDYAETCSALA